jgi:hypothetical protein
MCLSSRIIGAPVNAKGASLAGREGLGAAP